METNRLGGDDLAHKPLAVYPVIPGVEVWYYKKACPTKEYTAISQLADLPSSILLRGCPTDGFFFIHAADKRLPVAFSRYRSEITILLAPDQLKQEDMKAFPEILEVIWAMPERFCVKDRVCVIKVSAEIKKAFENLQQIPLPPACSAFICC
jgi:hypothetical protein